MKIRYLSDLHLEFTQYLPDPLPSIGEDLVVLAGDIGVGVKGIEWAQRAIPDRPVVYVLGNHEFYGRDFDRLIVDARLAAAGSNVHLLENDELSIPWHDQTLRVLGCSLWTDFAVFGEHERAATEQEAWDKMRDYTAIRHRRWFSLTPTHTRQRCLASFDWLQKKLSLVDGPTLVVTHHAPTLATVNPKFAGERSNGAFHNAFDDLLRPPVRAWIHGHHHHCCEVKVNGIPVVSNQQGYPSEQIWAFSWDRLLDLGDRP